MWKIIPGCESKIKKYEASSTGEIRSIDKRTGNIIILSKYQDSGYTKTSLGKVHQHVALAFYGYPPDDTYTPHHIDKNTKNNIVENIRWETKKNQALDRRKRSRVSRESMPVIATKISTGVCFHFDDISDAVIKLNANQQNISACINGKLKTHNGYTWSTPQILPDLPGEVWNSVTINNNKYEVLVSTHGRLGYKYKCGYIKKISSNELSSERRIEERDAYATIVIKGKEHPFHVIIWRTFRGDIPDGKVVNHINHDKQDNHLENLELLTPPENTIAAYDIGKFDNTKVKRKKCTGYKDGKEISFDSLQEAEKWLRSNGYPKARASKIGYCISENGKLKTYHGFVWK
jgi:hypothetical protein